MNRFRGAARAIFSVGLAVTSLASLGDAVAHEGEHHPIAVQPAEMYRPTAIPDRIVLSWDADPRTGATVNWRTSTDVTQAWAEIAVAEAGPYFAEKAKQIEAQSMALKTDINTAHFHSVRFSDLTPGMKYVYRVGDGANWSEWFQFRTAADQAEPFSFIYFGDAQNNIRSMWSRVIREAHRDSPRAAFILHAGDLVNTAESDAEWGEWFGAGSWLNAMTPTLAIPGNHEQAKLPDGSRRLSHHWQSQFALPSNGPAGLEETCYTLTYQNMRLIGLNSNEKLEQQAEWLKSVLAENTSRWVVLTFHHPVFSTAKDRDNAALRGLWKPIIDQYAVDLVLQGHDHTYGRTGLEVPNQPDANPEVTPVTLGNVATGVQAREPQTGTVYVVSVSGPKMYNINRRPFMKRVAEDTQLYQVISIDGDKLRFEARTAVGQLYDAFELVKRDGEPNQLTEIPAEVAEHTRPIIEEETPVGK
jgi:3',5'-cyclic AMP phosphodiesterase CpdA